MGADKGGTKSGGFFNLFDWNRKPRKKLFSSVSPEGTKRGKICDENLRVTQLRLIDEGETAGALSVRGSSDYSCASSVTDEDGNGVRPPGVVARLMGLDSMPTMGVPETYRTTPLFDTQSLRDNHCDKRSPEFCINDRFSRIPGRGEGYTRKLMDLRSQKMPSSPIERFQTEVLPPRSAKSISMSHHKLLSPVKNHSFITPKNAAHIMEAAARILEPGLHDGIKSKVSALRPVSVPLKVRDAKESLFSSQRASRISESARTPETIDARYLQGQYFNRTSRILESARTPAETTDARYLQGQCLNRTSRIPDSARTPAETTDARYLDEQCLNRTSRILESARTPAQTTDAVYLQGQYLNRSWTDSECTSVFRCSPESEGKPPSSAKDKGKSISLAVQAKVNVQRREGLSTTNRNALDHNDHERGRLNQTFKSQSSNQRNKPQKKPLTTNTSGVLRQNNQKQNCSSSKARSSSKQPVPNQQGRKNISGEAYSGRNRTANKLSGTSRVGFRKECSETAELDREGSASSNKDFPQKKRLIDRGFHSDKVGFTGNNSASRLKKHVQPNVVIDEHVRWREDDRRDDTDVVSFTFTSPLIKPMHGSQSSVQAVGKLDKNNACSFDINSDKYASMSKDRRLSSNGLNSIGGDALSLLLEQKLRELTAGIELSDCSFVNAGSSASSGSLTQESGSASTASVATGAEHMEFLQRPFNVKTDAIFGFGGFGVSSTNGHMSGIGHKLQGLEEVECSSSSDARKQPDHRQPSPFSVLESSFSNESCNSSKSSGSMNGTKLLSSSVQAQNFSSNCSNKIPSVGSENELLDSASSLFTENKDGGCASEFKTGNMQQNSGDAAEFGTVNMDTYKVDLEYVREVLQNTGLMCKDTGACYLTKEAEVLDPHFDKLEKKRSWSADREDKGSRLRRKMVFDCVNECVDLRCSRYFRAGYQAWIKGLSAGKELAEEIYREIYGWTNMGDWMVDELVDKDMSNHLGRWVDFQIEAFETGVEVEREILSSLVDEVIADFLVEAPCR